MGMMSWLVRRYNAWRARRAGERICWECGVRESKHPGLSYNGRSGHAFQKPIVASSAAGPAMKIEQG